MKRELSVFIENGEATKLFLGFSGAERINVMEGIQDSISQLWKENQAGVVQEILFSATVTFEWAKIALDLDCLLKGDKGVVKVLKLEIIEDYTLINEFKRDLQSKCNPKN